MKFRIPSFGGHLRKNVPPEYRDTETIHENWQRFFQWGLELRQPHVTISELPDAEVIRHPIGFIAVYLSARAHGVRSPGTRGVIRANVILPGVRLNDDIHSHGFYFTSGLVAGEVTNNRYDMRWDKKQPDGEGYIGYETKPDAYGKNRVKKATTATIWVPEPIPQELAIGDSYAMMPKNEFHSLAIDGGITIFGKQPAGAGGMNFIDDTSLILRKADQPPPPPEY